MKFRLLARLSLFLLCLFVAFWFVSLFECVVLIFPAAPHHVGGLGILPHSLIFGTAPVPPHFEMRSLPSPPLVGIGYNLLGFRYDNSPGELLFGFPFWFLILLCALGVHVFQSRARQVPPGHCKTCGYDLRASKDRCPECATPITKSESESESTADERR